MNSEVESVTKLLQDEKIEKNAAQEKVLALEEKVEELQQELEKLRDEIHRSRDSSSSMSSGVKVQGNRTGDEKSVPVGPVIVKTPGVKAAPNQGGLDEDYEDWGDNWGDDPEI